MHPDLALISDVWGHDRQLDQHRAEIERLAADLARADREVTSLDQRLNEARPRLAAMRDQERVKNRELEQYQEQRDRTRRLIDTGATPNYAASEKQLQQTNAIIDRLETELLDLMDQREGAERALRLLERDHAAATQAKTAAAEAKAAREPELRAGIAALLPKREAAWREVPTDFRSPYEELRRKRRPALVNIEEGVCQGCQMRITPQWSIDVRMGRAVHQCPGCQGFLLP